MLDRRLDISGWNTAYRETVHDLSAVPGERRNLLLLLVGDLTEAVPEWPRLLRALHGWFRSGTDHLPDDPRVAAIRRLLAAERPDLAHWWRCRAVADFASTTLEVRGVPMTLSLLRPDASADAAVLACTPVRASSAPPAAERLRSG
nr:hypothetical protein [Actinacidiphila yeochonensis]